MFFHSLIKEFFALTGYLDYYIWLVIFLFIGSGIRCRQSIPGSCFHKGRCSIWYHIWASPLRWEQSWERFSRSFQELWREEKWSVRRYYRRICNRVCCCQSVASAHRVLSGCKFIVMLLLCWKHDSVWLDGQLINDILFSVRFSFKIVSIGIQYSWL